MSDWHEDHPEAPVGPWHIGLHAAGEVRLITSFCIAYLKARFGQAPMFDDLPS